jgi:xanthine dehydrogenase accessory factor
MPATILIRGAGDLASGVALRLYHSGLNIVMCELAQPLAVRRAVCFAEAIYDGRASVEGVVGRKIDDPTDMLKCLNAIAAHNIPVLIDPSCVAAKYLHPLVIVDGRMTKKPPESFEHKAQMYIGLGPGFLAPVNCHAVIETQRGHLMGRAILQGSAREDTAVPDGEEKRVLRAPAEGVLQSDAFIGQHFEPGGVIAVVSGIPVVAPFAGVLRGLLRSGLRVNAGMKVGDLDVRDDPTVCRLVSDKALAVGGGVLEAMLTRPEVRAKLWA